MALRPDKSLREIEDWRVLARTKQQQQEYAAGAAARSAGGRRFAPVFVLFGLGLLAFGLRESHAVWRLELSGARAPGVVRSFETARDDPNSLAVVFHAVVTYTTSSGRQLSFKDQAGYTSPLYPVGEAVTVLYRPDVPSSAIIDRGVWRNWLPAVALYVLGSLFSAVGIKWIIAPRASAPTVARTGP
jgi:Protein of unknown function (DUF3592)